MENMYNKIVKMCHSLSELTTNDLNENGIESIIIIAWSNNSDGVTLTKGGMGNVLAMIGHMLARISNSNGILLHDLLNTIYEVETKIEQREKEGGEPDDIY